MTQPSPHSTPDRDRIAIDVDAHGCVIICRGNREMIHEPWHEMTRFAVMVFLASMMQAEKEGVTTSDFTTYMIEVLNDVEAEERKMNEAMRA